MAPRNNLIGQKINHLTVLAWDKEKSQEKKRTYWVVECDCPSHTIFSVLGSNLSGNITTKCKYCKAKNLIGQTFNKLKVIERVIDEQDHVKWKCQCECGNIIIVRGDSLKSGHTKSCGCLQKAHAATLNTIDLTGKKFGKLTVIQRSENKNSNGQYFWYCDCDCGTKNKEIDGHNLVSRGTCSCGCLKSKGELKIANLLAEANIQFIHEYSLKDFTFDSGKPPRFDFAITDENKNIKYFIEYHGEQHYQARENGIFTEDKVFNIQARDNIKIQYCKEKGIPLIIIPYTHYEKMILSDLLLNSQFLFKEKYND